MREIQYIGIISLSYEILWEENYIKHSTEV